jgi:hypothetical protein
MTLRKQNLISSWSEVNRTFEAELSHTNFQYRWTAGRLLAGRLASAAKKPSVLLAEARGDGANIEYRVPYDRFSNQLVSDLDYSYKTVP